jgi:hypothetical protein
VITGSGSAKILREKELKEAAGKMRHFSELWTPPKMTWTRPTHPPNHSYESFEYFVPQRRLFLECDADFSKSHRITKSKEHNKEWMKSRTRIRTWARPNWSNVCIQRVVVIKIITCKSLRLQVFVRVMLYCHQVCRQARALKNFMTMGCGLNFGMSSFGTTYSA